MKNKNYISFVDILWSQEIQDNKERIMRWLHFFKVFACWTLWTLEEKDLSRLAHLAQHWLLAIGGKGDIDDKKLQEKNHTDDKSVLSLRHQPHSLWHGAQSMLSLRREPSFVPPWRVRRRCAAWWPWPPEWKRKWFSFVWNRREEGQHVKPACNGVAQFDQPALVYRERAKSVKFLRHPKGWKHITNC